MSTERQEFSSGDLGKWSSLCRHPRFAHQRFRFVFGSILCCSAQRCRRLPAASIFRGLPQSFLALRTGTSCANVRIDRRISLAKEKGDEERKPCVLWTTARVFPIGAR